MPVFCQLGLGEGEQTAPVDVLDERAERVGEPARLSGEQGRRDVQGGGRGASTPRERRRRERPGLEPGNLLGQRGEHALVAVQQRRRAVVSRVSQQVGQRPEIEPEIAQPAEIGPRDARPSKQSRVDATRTCPRQDVDVDDHVEQVDEFGVELEAGSRLLGESAVGSGRFPPALRHWDACASKLISRATPAIQIARLTPPVMVVASRSSCVDSVTGDGLSNAIGPLDVAGPLSRRDP